MTLRRNDDILVQIRFKGGATQELHLPLPKSAWALRKTKPEIIAEIDRLLNEHSESEVARIVERTRLALQQRKFIHAENDSSASVCLFLEASARAVQGTRMAHRARGSRAPRVSLDERESLANGWLA